MQTKTSQIGLLGAVALTCASVSAQISYAENFDAMPTFAAPTGYTNTGFTVYDGATTCSGTGKGIRVNLYSGFTAANTGYFLGISTGNPIAFNFDYKVHVWAANTVPATAPWGTIQVQLSNSPAGPWTTIGTITDEAQTAGCIAKSFSATPTPGAVFFRFNCTWSGGDNYWNIDNVDVQETIPCTGTPNPGNTIGPAGSCPGANFTLSLQNNVTGTGVSYQWESSTVSGSGPWTPISGANAKTLSTTQAVATWYRCAVTCATGPATGNSVALNVPLSTPTFPQDFGTGVVDPNCWTASALVGVDLPDYNPLSAYGAGTGSARFNFYGILPGDELALTSPEFAPTAPGAVAVFDVAGTTYTGGEVDQIILEESNDGGLTWNPVVVLDNSVGGVLNTLGATSGASYAPGTTEWASLVYPVSAGTNRIRFHGISDFGNNVYIDNAGVLTSPPSYHATIGQGCYDYVGTTLAEEFPSAAAWKAKLDGNSLVFINTGTSYIALWTIGGGAAYVAPVSPTVHTVGDEGEVVITPSLATPAPGGAVTDWTIHANGVITAGTVGNTASYFGMNRAAMGADTGLAFYTFADMNEGAAGQVVSEEVGNMLYITWDAVETFANPGDTNTFQYQIDMSTGNVSIVWVSMGSIDVETNIVGATLAGAGQTPPSTDLTTAVPFVFGTGDMAAMNLSVVGAPINNGPAPVYTISNIPEYFPGAGFSGLAVVFGFTQIPGGVNLGPGPFDIGADGCSGYMFPDVIVIIGLVPFGPVSFPIPWSIPSAPGQLWMQAVAEFVPGTLPNGQNIGGKVTSNALEIFIENF